MGSRGFVAAHWCSTSQRQIRFVTIASGPFTSCTDLACNPMLHIAFQLAQPTQRREVGCTERNFGSYIEDLKKRKGPDADQPHRVTYRKLVRGSGDLSAGGNGAFNRLSPELGTQQVGNRRVELIPEPYRLGVQLSGLHQLPIGPARTTPRRRSYREELSDAYRRSEEAEGAGCGSTASGDVMRGAADEGHVDVAGHRPQARGQRNVGEHDDRCRWRHRGRIARQPRQLQAVDAAVVR